MRLRTFHRSATTGNKGHAGGVTYHGMFGPDVDDLSIQVHVKDRGDWTADVHHAYIAYVERLLIWDYAAKQNCLPKCNSE